MKKVFFIFTLMVFSAVLFQGCQKDEFGYNPSNSSSNQKVLNESVNPIALLQSQHNGSSYSIIHQVAQLENQHHFLNHLSSRIGNPFWQSSLIYNDTIANKQIVYVPFGFYNGNETKALLVGVRDLTSAGNYNIQLIPRSDIINYENVSNYIDEYTLDIFAVFDKEIFKQQNCIICDYFELIKRVNLTRKNQRECTYLQITLCFDVECPDTGTGSGSGTGTGGWHTGGGTGIGSGRPNLIIFFPPGNDGDDSGDDNDNGNSGGGGETEEADYPDGYKKPKKVNVNKGCPFQKKIKDEDISQNRSICTFCDEYLIKICDDNPNWWNQVWNLEPCHNCSNFATPLGNTEFEQKCKANKNAFIKVKYKLPYTVTYITNSIEGKCDCIGNNNYETCVLNTLLLEKLQVFSTHYPILVPGTTIYYTAQELLDLDIIPYSCLSSGDFNECAAENIIESVLGECQPLYVKSTGLNPNADCGGIITGYVPCSDIILTQKGNEYFSQLEIEQYIVALCFPQPEDSEIEDSKLGILKSANLKLEIQISAYLINNNIFSYTDLQSKLSILFSEGLNYASETVPLTNPCNNLELLRIKFRKAFFDYVQDPSIKANIFGSTAGSIQIYNRFIRVDITPEKTKPVTYSSATECK